MMRVVKPLVGHSLQVIINDGTPQEFRIEDGRFLLRLQARLDRNEGQFAAVRMKFQLNAPHDVIEALDKIDGRRLGLGFESTLLLSVTDIHGRLSMLERALFGDSLGTILTQLERRPGNSLPTHSAPRHQKRSTIVRRLRTQLLINCDQPSPTAPLIELEEQVSLTRAGKTKSAASAEKVLGRGWFPTEHGGHGVRSTSSVLSSRCYSPPRQYLF